MTEHKKSHSLFEHLFLRFGAGSGIFRPLVRWRRFNVIAWAVIVIGVAGWVFLFWFLRTYVVE